MPDHVELDSIQDRVMADGSSVSRTTAERLPVMFTGSSHICSADGVERNEVDGVDLNVAVAHRVYAADSHLRPLPKAKRDRDAACDYLVA